MLNMNIKVQQDYNDDDIMVKDEWHNVDWRNW